MIDIEIKNPLCEIMDKDCPNTNSCKYLYDRFGVLECMPDKAKSINTVHKYELQQREELLKDGGGRRSGENYNRKLDLSYKDAVIDKQADKKREC